MLCQRGEAGSTTGFGEFALVGDRLAYDVVLGVLVVGSPQSYTRGFTGRVASGRPVIL